MSNYRLKRVTSMIIQELNKILSEEVKDEVLKNVSVTDATVDNDLTFATIYFMTRLEDTKMVEERTKQVEERTYLDVGEGVNYQIGVSQTRLNNCLKELERQNVPHAKIVLAQSKLETGGYTSKVCKTHNNIFGIRKNNKYKRYDNYLDCIADYKKHISSKYKGGDYYVFLEIFL